MKKVSKKTKFLAVVLGSLLISSSAFAVDLTIDNSAVKRATAGQFSTDSDKVKAKDIFDLERSFFSAGYLGNAGIINGGNVTDPSGNQVGGNGTTTARILDNGVQGAFGVALPGGMYLGFAAAYNFKDSADYTTGKDTINGTKWQIGSTANVIAAFRINEMVALHYNFTLDGITPYNVYQTKNTAGDDYKTYNNAGLWRHEIAAAIKFGEHKLTVPVSVRFDAYNKKEKGTKYLNTDTDMAKIDVDNVDYTDGDGIWLGLNPEFFLSLPAGPMTGINMGLNLEAKLTHNVGKNGVFADQNQGGTGTPTYTKNEYKTTQKAAAVNIGVWASFPMEWSLGNDQVSLAMEPQINLDFNVNNLGKMEQSIDGAAQPVTDYGKDYLNINPYVELPIGTLWRPLEWYELRFGTALLLGADITINQSKDANGKTDKNTTYETMSGIAGFFGMGFIVGEDFNIDLFAEVGTLSFINMNFGGQLTYRFN